MTDSNLRKPPNYSSRPMQYRLMMLVTMLMVVILLMAEAAKPKNWEWMWKLDKTADAAAAEQTGPAAIDTRLQATTPKAVHTSDSFQSEVASPSDFESAIETHADQATFNDITPELLSTIEDDTFFRNEESNAWVLFLGLLRTMESTEIEQNSVGEISFAQLFRQTEEFRGKLVTVDGVIRRAHRVPAASNQLGIENYWQCWIRPTDGSNSPLVVYSLNVPDDVAQDANVHQPARVTGFCFKRWAYNSASGPRIAPVLLAKNIELQPDAVSFGRPPLSSSTRMQIITASIVVGLCVACVALIASRWNRKRFDSVERTSVSEFSNSMADVHVPTVQEKLRGLETVDTRETETDN
ncbi:MAG: hypothetical protein KDB27_01990 [Planctomycetales bacterium]|nr:hypothetical protein [Planctomycetales bacterium]